MQYQSGPASFYYICFSKYSKLYSPSHPVPTKTGAHQRFENEDNPGGLIFWWALGGNDLGALEVIKCTRAPICRNAIYVSVYCVTGLTLI